MISRRDFVTNAAVSLMAVPAFAAEPFTCRSDGSSLHVFTSSNGSDVRAFRAACAATSTQIDADMGPALERIGSGNAIGGRPVYFGLTRDIEYLILSQVAMEQGYLEIYSGQHHASDAGVIHRLEGLSSVVTALSRKLATTNCIWPEALARFCRDPALTATTLSGGARALTVHTTQIARPGSLTSWALIPSEATV